jgi:hypothetical protein
MRSFVRGFALLTLALLLGGRTEAQVVGPAEQGCFLFPIELVPGPQRVLAQAPKYIAVADFNNDKFDDVVVSNSASSKVTVVFGQDGTSFGSVADLNVGRVLRGVQAGDLNNDGIPDIATVDWLDGRAFVVTSNGDGTFNQPVGYKVGLRPIDLAIGNFDRQKGNDLMVCDQLSNAVGVYLNQGLGRGFSSIGEFPAGASAKRCKAADLNGDGFDDIVVLSTNGPEPIGSVSILLNAGNQGNASFLTPARNFVVGLDAKDFAIADFNNDGVPDLAVLNGGVTSVQNEFSMSILLNTVAGGKGTGLFSDATPVRISCPRTLGGIAVTCTPNFIAAGDFDNDGFIDLAVSFSTLGNTNTGAITTPGLIQAYEGHGDGTFDFSSQVSVGADPQGIAAGDFNGDGMTDLAVAERGSHSVRILSARLPSPPPGEGCHVGCQCASGFCVQGVCCSTACLPDQFCDIPGSAGRCAPPAPTGHPCTDSHQCNSGFCVDGYCCSTGICPVGQFCNSGTCGPPAPVGSSCTANDQCNSGHCTDGVCCADDRCPAGQACNIPLSEGVCAATLPPGQPCTDDAQCRAWTPGAPSGFCTDLFCCSVRVCPTGQSCAVASHEGLCTVLSPGCIGDCDHGGTVTIDELLVMVNVAVDNAPTSRCEAGDSNGDGLITVDEILAAVHRALAGCSS